MWWIYYNIIITKITIFLTFFQVYVPIKRYQTPVKQMSIVFGWNRLYIDPFLRSRILHVGTYVIIIYYELDNFSRKEKRYRTEILETPDTQVYSLSGERRTIQYYASSTILYEMILIWWVTYIHIGIILYNTRIERKIKLIRRKQKGVW